MELQHGDAAEQVGAQQHTRGAPGGEGGQRQRDPALAGDHALDPQRRVDGGHIGARQPAERAAGHHGHQPDAAHRVAERVRRLRALAHAAQHQAGARAVEEPDQPEDEADADVDHGVVAEQRRPQQRDVAQHGNVELHLLGQLFLHIAGARKGREARAEQRQRQPGGVLVGVEPDHQAAEDSRQQGARRHARGKTGQRAAGVHHGGKTGQGGTQHHALGAQVDDAGLFVDEQAQRSDGQHGAGLERGGEEQSKGFHGHFFQTRR
ncbi:hypothetical protein D9M68_678740 [compost metagenome]